MDRTPQENPPEPPDTPDTQQPLNASAGPPHRHRNRLAVTLVAGAVLVAGGGSAYWAASAAGGARSAPAAQGKDGGPAPLPGGPWATAVPGGPYRLTGTLPAGPDSAPVHTPRGPVPRADVARLAAALGIPGSVRADHGLWRAGTGGGPALQVGQDAPGSWVFTRAGAPCAPPAGSGTAVCYAPGRAVPRATGPAGSPVSAAGAERAAAPLLAALGLADARLDASGTAGALRTVTADPRVGGLPVHGWTTTVQVAPDGSVTSASGRLSRLAAGASYPVVTARQAFARLGAAGSGAAGRACPTMRPGAAGGPADPGDLPGVSAVPCVAARQPALVRGAVFGLSAQYVAGVPELVPSWLFRVAAAGAGGETVLALPAVDPRFIAAASPTVTPSTGSAGPARVRITSYAADGAVLTLRFWGGVCSDYSASVAGRSAGTVTVRVTEVPRHPGAPCVLLARSDTARVRLPAPLAAGTVVRDGFDGRALPRA